MLKDSIIIGQALKIKNQCFHIFPHIILEYLAYINNCSVPSRHCALPKLTFNFVSRLVLKPSIVRKDGYLLDWEVTELVNKVNTRSNLTERNADFIMHSYCQQEKSYWSVIYDSLRSCRSFNFKISHTHTQIYIYIYMVYKLIKIMEYAWLHRQKSGPSAIFKMKDLKGIFLDKLF